MGNQSALGSYASQLNNQQQQAYNSGLDAVNTEQQKLNAYGNTAGMTSTDAQLKQSNLGTERDNNYRLAGNIVGAGANVAGAFVSDENTKKYAKAVDLIKGNKSVSVDDLKKRIGAIK